MKIRLSESESYEINLPEEISKEDLSSLMEKLATISQLSHNSTILSKMSNVNYLASSNAKNDKISVRKKQSQFASFLHDREESLKAINKWNNGNYDERNALAEKYNLTRDRLNKAVAYARVKYGVSQKAARKYSSALTFGNKEEFQAFHEKWKNSNAQEKLQTASKLGVKIGYLYSIVTQNKKKFLGSEMKNGN